MVGVPPPLCVVDDHKAGCNDHQAKNVQECRRSEGCRVVDIDLTRRDKPNENEHEHIAHEGKYYVVTLDEAGDKPYGGDDQNLDHNDEGKEKHYSIHQEPFGIEEGSKGRSVTIQTTN